MRWTDGGPDHSRDLKSFTCADPNGKKFDRFRRQKIHPAPWAEDVQRELRRWNFARHRNRRMRLGYNDSGDRLIGVTVVSGPATVLPQDSLEPDAEVSDAEPADPGASFTIDFMAVAFQDQSLGLGSEVLAQALDCVVDDLTADESGIIPPAVLVQAVVHESNMPAQNLLASFGFAQVDVLDASTKNTKGKSTGSQRYGVWAVSLTLL